MSSVDFLGPWMHFSLTFWGIIRHRQRVNWRSGARCPPQPGRRGRATGLRDEGKARRQITTATPSCPAPADPRPSIDEAGTSRLLHHRLSALLLSYPRVSLPPHEARRLVLPRARALPRCFPLCPACCVAAAPTTLHLKKPRESSGPASLRMGTDPPSAGHLTGRPNAPQR